MSRIWFLFTIYLAALLLVTGCDTAAPGVTQLHESQPAVLPLDSGWQYRWGDSPVAADGTRAWLLDPPDSPAWQPVAEMGQLTAAREERMLWLRLQLPAGGWRDPAVFLDSVEQGLEAYLDESLIYRAGQVDRTGGEPALGTIHHMIHLPPDFAGKMLTLRMYSEYNTIGPRTGVFLGDHADHLLAILKTDIDRFILSFFFIIVGLVALLFYLRRTDQTAYLALGVFSIAGGAFGVFRTQLIELFITNTFVQEYGKLAAIFLVPVGLAAFFEQVVSPGPRHLVRRLWQMHLAYAGGALALALLGVVQPLNTILPYEILVAFTLAALVLISARELLRGNVDAQLFTVGYSLVLFFALLEILDDVGIIDLRGRVLHWGVLGFLITLILILMRRFNQAIKDRAQLITIRQELNIAHRIQQNLLPPPRPDWPAPEVICLSIPAREMGGDLYAYHAFDNGDRALLVGDVSGKGMPAALLMAISLASVRAAMNHALTPGRLLSHLDSVIKPYTRTTHQNCALCYVELHHNETATTVRAANAGCVYPLVRRTGGQVEWLEVGGLPLGVELSLEFNYPEITTQLFPGDMLILTSDGIIEAHNSHQELFGFERLAQAVAAGPATSAEAMLAHLRHVIGQFADVTEPHDDMTAVVIRI